MWSFSSASLTVVIAIALALAGCSSKDATKDAIEAAFKNCAKPASFELRISSVSSELIIKCDEVGPVAPRVAEQPIKKET